MQFREWDFENDIIDTKTSPLFDKSIDTAANHMGSAYAVDTATGIYYQRYKPDGKHDLIHVDEKGESVCMENVVVCAADMHYTAMIVHVCATGENYLLDTRGIFFYLDSKKETMDPSQYRFRLDRKTGFYNIESRTKLRWLIRGISKAKMFDYMLASAADTEAQINGDFTSMLRKTPPVSCLYLTCPKTKKGSMIKSLLNNGIEYEVLPNALKGDDTYNVRIPRTQKNIYNRGFHFLDSKYLSTYAIKGISIETLIAILHLSLEVRNKLKINIPNPSDKQFREGSAVINTLKELLNIQDDYDLLMKFFNKILNLFEKGEPVKYVNCFDALRFPYPEAPTASGSREINKGYINSQRGYAEKILLKRPLPDLERLDNVELFQLCKELYEAGKIQRKTMMDEFEAAIK